MMIGPWQIALIVILILLVFGAGRLPRVMEDLAKGIKSFKKGMKDDEADQPKITHSKSADENIAEKTSEKTSDKADEKS